MRRQHFNRPRGEKLTPREMKQLEYWILNSALTARDIGRRFRIHEGVVSQILQKIRSDRDHGGTHDRR
jgi:DNA-binding CsgD family transcriptional regulator